MHNTATMSKKEANLTIYPVGISLKAVIPVYYEGAEPRKEKYIIDILDE